MKPVYLNMPVGDYYGWAVCGKNLLRELSEITDVRYVNDGFEIAFRDEETEKMVKKRLVNIDGDMDCPMIHTISDNSTCKSALKYKGNPNIGYMFYESDKMSEKQVNMLNNSFDHVAVGSVWMKNVLESYGVKNITVIHQGVDRKIFNAAPKKSLTDRFVIFSGGKYEHRKAQDIVIDSVGELQKQYEDVFLIASWDNIFELDSGKKAIKSYAKKIDLNRTSMVALMPQNRIAGIMRETDIGIFPNRAEGGTNLVMMEYLACGRPVIASITTGQKDVLEKDYTFPIEATHEDKVRREEAYHHLKYYYHHRDQLQYMGENADRAMNRFSWKDTAAKFYELCEA